MSKSPLGNDAKKRYTKCGWIPSNRKYFKIGEKFSTCWLISYGFPLFFEKSKIGIYFLKIEKIKKSTMGIHAKKGHTKFGWNPSTRKYFKIGENFQPAG